MITTILSKDGKSFEILTKLPRPTQSNSNKFGNIRFEPYVKKTKQEHDTPNRSSSFIAHLYASIPILGDGGPISRKMFTARYNLCLDGLSPKHIRTRRNITM